MDELRELDPSAAVSGLSILAEADHLSCRLTRVIGPRLVASAWIRFTNETFHPVFYNSQAAVGFARSGHVGGTCVINIGDGRPRFPIATP